LTRVFFLPAHAVGAVWIALGIRRVAKWTEARFASWPMARWAALSALGMVAVLLPFRTHFTSNDESRSYLAEEWGRNIFQSLPPDAIIVPSADHSTFPLVYLQAAEGLRPDVLIADKYGYIDEAALEKLFEGKDAPRAPPPLGREAWERERYLVEKSGRPVYLTTKSRIPGLETYEIVTWGLIFEAVRKDSKPDEAKHEALWQGFRFRPGSLERPPGNFSYDLILSDYHYARARWALLFGREKEALGEIARSERHGFGVKEIHNNLGGTLAEYGKADLAIPCLRRALAVDPDYDLATRNISNAYFTLKRYAEGLPWFNRALSLDPDNPVARLGKARAHRAFGQAAEAYFAYMRVFRSDPRSETLRSEIKEFVEKEFGKKSTLADLGPGAPRPSRPDPFDDDFQGGPPASPPARSWDGLGGHLALPPDPLESFGQ
jgi:tetratricopeptide (TPR) repeat protein